MNLKIFNLSNKNQSNTLFENLINNCQSEIDDTFEYLSLKKIKSDQIQNFLAEFKEIDF